ncbi:MAG TPA: BamA/TamA family outer membrane protein [Bryobacteraceae bacterium]|nr:BamA/TamA family outer membrane protein [Bryobacteraceae bacterium]
MHLQAQNPPDLPFEPDATSAASTRAGQIEAARKAKAASIPPVKPHVVMEKGESAVTKGFNIWNFTQVGTHGLSLKLGGLAIGSGLGFGPEYVLKRGELYNPRLVWDSYAIGSFQGYYRLQSALEFPRLLRDRGFFSITALRFDYPRLAYYGPGPDSRITGYSDYRMQDNDLEIRGGFRPWNKSFRVGLVGGFQGVTIGPGTRPGYAHTDELYPVTQARGDDRAATFLSGGFFLQFDTRDSSGDPHAGTYLFAQFQNVNGSRRSLGGFNQYDFDAQHYFHYWNKRRVIATRIKATLTTPHPGTFVPFYLEPRLGGSDDLRGFRPYRFYDQNAVVATAEYRWTAVEALDMALFADAGKVYHDSDTLSLSHFQSDIGVGFRFKSRDSVPVRLDIGVSREGVQIWLNFYNVF